VQQAALHLQRSVQMQWSTCTTHSNQFLCHTVLLRCSTPKQCSFVNFAVSVGYRQQAFAMSQFVTQSSGRELTSISLSGISHIEVFLCCRLPAAVRKSSQAAKDEAMFGVLMRAYGALCPVKVTAGGHSPFVVKPKGMERQSTRSSWVQQGQRKGHK
jgi:hypothetical protein